MALSIESQQQRRVNGDNGVEAHEIRIKLVFNAQVLVSYIKPFPTLEQFFKDIRHICSLAAFQAITVKWVDDEGDPCTISTQRELSEAVRLYELNGDAALVVHVFMGEPAAAGLACQGESRAVYRRGARRWKKYYRVNGHRFQAKRFNRRAVCQSCGDAMWGLGRQGYRCVECRLCVHKKCHRLLQKPCSGQPMESPFPLTEEKKAAEKPKVHVSEAYPIADGYDNQSFPSATEVPIVVPREAYQAAPTSSSNRITLDDFTLLKCIGRGSYAKVLQVELKRTKQIYAMKIIKKQMFTEEEDIDWVQTEKSVFETASNHPFLVGLHSCFQTESRLFFVIEFVPGGDLMFHMQRQMRLPEEHARFYAAEIVCALHYLHSRGIIYRDLKLDNVLIDADGHVKLTDYGMCKENIGPGDVTSTFCGTPNYIAPEILRGLDYGFSVDWWALGVLMYEMMAGRSPFDVQAAGENPDAASEDYLFQVILEKQIRIPRRLSVKASSALRGFLNKEPAERLGCDENLELALDNIKNHTFFRTVEWDLLENRGVTPPYRPAITSERDLEYFDLQFTTEEVNLTPDDPSLIARIDQTEFDGFEYINPLLMSTEDAV